MQTDTPQRRLKEKLREVRTGLILDVAEKVLVEKGYRDSSMDEIAARAGVAKGTLYQHFSRKEDLVFALFERSLALFEQTVQQTAVSPLAARAKLERILLSVCQQQSGPHAQLLQLLYHNVDIRKGLFEKKEQLRDRLKQCAAQIRSIVEEGKAEGEFDPTIPTELMLLTFMRSLWLSQSEQLLVQEQLSPEELARQVGRMLFDGFAIKK